MQTFKDTAGRTWTIAVDVDGIRRVRTALQINLVSAKFADVLQQLLDDPVVLCDVIYVLVTPQADALKLSDIDFGRAMAGDALENGAKALLEEIALFSPNRRDRERILKVLKTLYQLAEMKRDEADGQMDEAAETLLKQSENQIYGRSSGNSPASSESTPAP